MNDTPPRPRLRRLALRTLHVGPEVRAIGDAAVVCRRVVKMEVVTDLRATVEPREFAAPHCPACAWASDLCDCPPPLPPVEALLPLWRRYVDESRGIDRGATVRVRELGAVARGIASAMDELCDTLNNPKAADRE